MSKISPLAFVDPEAIIGENCEIGPFCFIDKNVVIGNDNTLMNSVSVLSGARIGNGNIFFPGAVISAIPQDLKFRGEETTAEVGNNNRIRENVTINRGTAAKGKTVVGNNNLLMEAVHIAHDAIVGNGCIIGNTTKIAGEVTVDDHAVISACVLIHQFCRIGSYAMVGGGTRTSQDIPPYATVAREPATVLGLNLVGLRRHGFTTQQIDTIHDAYRMMYDKSLIMNERLKLMEQSFPDSPEVKYMIEFVRASISPKGRGILY
ncbi:MAG: acyl-ACP--UDP-N-acetylglucosamine O-acyltransferase [Bacteroidaceae bacterium]|nr:acyl-ACP--UDP-N-acetylglucosamine O-acyltransferase [Bacteroidaceae bacterium]